MLVNMRFVGAGAWKQAQRTCKIWDRGPLFLFELFPSFTFLFRRFTPHSGFLLPAPEVPVIFCFPGFVPCSCSFGVEFGASCDRFRRHIRHVLLVFRSLCGRLYGRTWNMVRCERSAQSGLSAIILSVYVLQVLGVRLLAVRLLDFLQQLTWSGRRDLLLVFAFDHLFPPPLIRPYKFQLLFER